MAVGCIPAHALYFSAYETIKAFFLQNSNTYNSDSDSDNDKKNLGALGSTVAGATAALCHDAGAYILVLLLNAVVLCQI